MSNRATGPSGEYRFVIYNAPVVTASVYPLQATAYSKPLATMALSPWQELPVMEPGAVVQATKDFATVSFGDVVFVPTGSVLVEWPGVEGRIFAERGSVIVNPLTPGWESTWRSVGSESTQSVEHFRRQARRDVWGMVASLACALILIAVMIWGYSGGSNFIGYTGGGAGGSMASAIGLGRRARRSLKALDAARESSSLPARPFKMSIGWTVGHGHGPLAVASLWSDDEGQTRVRRVPVVGLPHGPLPKEPVEVLVRGSVTSGGVGTIEWGDHVLWPAE